MRKLSTEKRALILSCLVEGNSINSTSRLCGVSKVTVLRLLADAGTLAAQFHDLKVRGLKTQRVEMDEIWSFVGCKEKTKKLKGGLGHGDAWTWTAIDADTKLCVSYLVGGRDADTAMEFTHDTADRLDRAVQLTTDGLRLYIEAVEAAFGGAAAYAQLIKVFAGDRPDAARYSPPVCTGTRKQVMSGNPDESLVSTSYVERQNLTLRMQNRRFTRLTNAFSKKFENHCHAVALHYFHYNFCRKHATLKTTPAIAAGIMGHQWSMKQFVELLEREEKNLNGR
ncbi:MAG: IS1 family transposase, partial [Planctomycetota bacterium]